MLLQAFVLVSVGFASLVAGAIVEVPLNTIVVNQGKLTLTCASNASDEHLTWQKFDTDGNGVEFFECSPESPSGNCNLVVDKVTEEQASIYRCSSNQTDGDLNEFSAAVAVLQQAPVLKASTDNALVHSDVTVTYSVDYTSQMTPTAVCNYDNTKEEALGNGSSVIVSFVVTAHNPTEFHVTCGLSFSPKSIINLPDLDSSSPTYKEDMVHITFKSSAVRHGEMTSLFGCLMAAWLLRYTAAVNV